MLPPKTSLSFNLTFHLEIFSILSFLRIIDRLWDFFFFLWSSFPAERKPIPWMVFSLRIEQHLWNRISWMKHSRESSFDPVWDKLKNTLEPNSLKCLIFEFTVRHMPGLRCRYYKQSTLGHWRHSTYWWRIPFVRRLLQLSQSSWCRWGRRWSSLCVGL